MRFRWDNSRSREGSSLCLKASFAMNVYEIMQLHSFVKSHIENRKNLCPDGCLCTFLFVSLTPEVRIVCVLVPVCVCVCVCCDAPEIRYSRFIFQT